MCRCSLVVSVWFRGLSLALLPFPFLIDLFSSSARPAAPWLLSLSLSSISHQYNTVRFPDIFAYIAGIGTTLFAYTYNICLFLATALHIRRLTYWFATPRGFRGLQSSHLCVYIYKKKNLQFYIIMQLTWGKWAEGREKCEEHSNKSLLHSLIFFADKKNTLNLSVEKKCIKKGLCFFLCFVFMFFEWISFWKFCLKGRMDGGMAAEGCKVVLSFAVVIFLHLSLLVVVVVVATAFAIKL